MALVASAEYSFNWTQTSVPIEHQMHKRPSQRETVSTEHLIDTALTCSGPVLLGNCMKVMAMVASVGSSLD